MPYKKNISYANFIQRVKNTIDRYGMISGGDRVLVAVSGGADSVCLLRVLAVLKDKLGITLTVANMDHCLRGKESERDSLFVRDLAEKTGLPLAFRKIKIRSGKAEGLSFEEKAREERYRFFGDAARENGCNVIATGHNMDDQAESVMMRVLQGSSLAGLAGIPPVREDGDMRIIRPLIRVSRQEILFFLGRSRQTFVEDSSNRDTKFLRNKVRLEILPFLEKFNPSLKRNLVNLSDTLREDLELIRSVKADGVKGLRGRCDIDISDILVLPKTVRKDMLKELFRAAGGEVKKLTYRHWMDMDEFVKSAGKGKSLHLPGGVKLVKARGRIVFEK